MFNLATGRAIRFDGVYPDWDSARRAASGYDHADLLERLESAARAVASGAAAWEQDGVLFDHVPTNLPLLAGLGQMAADDLQVVDVGGGLGSTYRQARLHLDTARRLSWHVVEQPEVAAIGRRASQAPELAFHDSLDAALHACASGPALCLLSSVLQYVPEPTAILERLARSPVQVVVVDRHPVSFGDEIISVQRVPASIYRASYPCRLFAPGFLSAAMAPAFERAFDWAGSDPPIRGRGGIGAAYVGSCWRRRS